jgi:hypothetical protein
MATSARQRLLVLVELDPGEEALDQASEALERYLVAQARRAEQHEAQRERLGRARAGTSRQLGSKAVLRDRQSGLG